jgi:hypothetical protein
MSNDGKYVAFTINNLPVGNVALIIQDLRSDWKKEIITSEVGIIYFTKDGKNLCWQKGDSLFLEETGKSKTKVLGIAYKYTFPKFNKGEWIAFFEKEATNISLYYRGCF